MKKHNLPLIRGWNKTSEAGKDVFAYSLFLESCNFKCPYCMNVRLAKCEVKEVIPIDEIKDSVEDNEVEWIMISGGEPTCTDEILLSNLIEEIKSWGCKVGMSTNGSYPDILSKIIGRLNFIAMDIKSSRFCDYQQISESVDTKNCVSKSKILLELEQTRRPTLFDYEIRTTLYPPFFNDIRYNLHCIGSEIKKTDRWVFQQFRHSKNMMNPESRKIKPFNDEEIKFILNESKKYCDDVSIRYV